MHLHPMMGDFISARVGQAIALVWKKVTKNKAVFICVKCGKIETFNISINITKIKTQYVYVIQSPIKF